MNEPTVWILAIEHRHGTDVGAYRSRDTAMAACPPTGPSSSTDS